MTIPVSNQSCTGVKTISIENSGPKSRTAFVSIMCALCTVLIFGAACSKQEKIALSIPKDEDATLVLGDISIFFPKYSFLKKTAVSITKASPSSKGIESMITFFGDEYLVSADSDLAKPVFIRLTYDKSKLPDTIEDENLILLAKTKNGAPNPLPSIVDPEAHVIMGEAYKFDSILCGFSAAKKNNTLSIVEAAASDLPQEVANDLAKRAIGSENIFSFSKITSTLVSTIDALIPAITDDLASKPPFALRKEKIKQLFSAFLEDSIKRASELGEKEPLNYTISMTSPGFIHDTGSEQSAKELSVSSDSGTLVPGEEGSSVADDILTRLVSRQNEAVIESFDKLLVSLGPLLANASEEKPAYLVAFGIEDPKKNLMENGLVFYGAAGEAGTYSEFGSLSFRSIMELKKGEPQNRLGKKIDLSKITDPNEIKRIGASMLLSKNDFPGSMNEISNGFMTQNPFDDPYKEATPLGRMNLFDFGFLGAAIHGFQNSEINEKDTAKHQFLTFMYDPLIFKTDVGAHNALAKIRTTVSGEALAKSFMSEAQLGITLRIEPVTVRGGEESLAFLVHGKLERDSVKQDFTATIVIFRVKSILTVINSLSIGPNTLGAIEGIINILEGKIRNALGS
jgi:hypothetical protein